MSARNNAGRRPREHIIGLALLHNGQHRALSALRRGALAGPLSNRRTYLGGGGSPQALNRVRYSCGVTASSRRKLRRIVSSEPKPQRKEIRFAGRPDSDNNRRAASTRSRSIARAG